MFESNDLSRGRRSRWLAAALGVFLLAGVGGAQVEKPASVQEVEERFDVLPLRDGLLLRPREASEIQTLEIGNGIIAIDGVEADFDELVAAVGEEQAEVLTELADLPADELARLFGRLRPGQIDQEDELAAITEIEEELTEREAEISERLSSQLEELEERKRELQERLEERAEEVRERERMLREEARRRSRYRERHSGDAQVVVGGSVFVGSGEVVDEAVAIGGSVTVDGEVEGDAVAIGGSATIRGEVEGGVVAVGGGVTLSSDAVVHGDVVSVGGRVRREPGAQVHGQITEVSLWEGLFSPDFGAWSWRFDHQPRGYFDGSLGDLMESTINAVLLALVGLLLVTFMRPRLDRVAAQAAAQPIKAGVTGMLALLFFVPTLLVVILVLAISIIGIPLLLLVPFLVLGFVLAALFGYLAVAYQLGRWSERRFGWAALGPMAALIIGLVWLHAWQIMGGLMDVVDGPRDLAGFLVVLLVLFGCLVKFLAWSVGLGAVLLARREGRRARTADLPPPAPGGSGPEASLLEAGPGTAFEAPPDDLPDLPGGTDEVRPDDEEQDATEDPWDEWAIPGEPTGPESDESAADGEGDGAEDAAEDASDDSSEDVDEDSEEGTEPKI